MEKILLYDDFSKFPIGVYPSNYFATQEYHYLPPEGYKGDWYEATISYKWRPCNAAWLIIENDNKKKLLSTLDSSVPFNRILITGDPLWTNYKIKLKLQILNDKGFAGLVFRYKNNREFYSLIIEEKNKLKLLKYHHTEIEVLKEIQIHGLNNETEIEIEVNASEFSAFVNDEKLFFINDPAFKAGRAGLIANTTALFDYIKITTDEKSLSIYIEKKDKELKELEKLREQYPKPILWKKINTKGFGTGRQLRFGHLKNRKCLDILLAQNIKLQPEKDEYSTIRCLTAVDLSGNILWQFGEPSDSIEAAIALCDLPVQIYDIDNDGNDEVVFAKNFKLYILNGQNGSIKKMTSLPVSIEDENRFGFLCPDAVIIANFRGKKHPSDIIIKNRYHQVWVYDENLNLLWNAKRPKGKHPSNTGHFPVPYDINNDLRDELFIGYTLLDCEGKAIWNHDWPDHTDEIIIGRFNPHSDNIQIATASGDEGFCIFDANTGNVLHKELLGHAQRITAAKFRDDMPGLQFYVITYWHNTGIISFHDCTGKKLFSFEPTSLGNILNPVNWTGLGTELALLNTNHKNGGMIDGYGRKVVLFPEDDHPDLCCEAIDITGDKRSEIVTWDKDSIWIYTQDCDFKQEKIYDPIKPFHYNNSNYRGESSIPNWTKFKK
ncbi:MAG: hypothetical protein JXB50_09255 [Spirochaetes bacterium]|nr:hypothetical protein [Spirochaetota bacterium]